MIEELGELFLCNQGSKFGILKNFNSDQIDANIRSSHHVVFNNCSLRALSCH